MSSILEPPGETYLQPAQVAERYGVARNTVDSWYGAGLPFEHRDTKHGRARCQRESVIEAWLKKTGKLARIVKNLKTRAGASATSAAPATPVAVPAGGLFPEAAKPRERGTQPPKVAEVRVLFADVLRRCEDFGDSDLDLADINNLTAAMKRLSSEARLLEEHAVEQLRASGEWIEASRAKNAVVGIAALFSTDTMSLAADVVSEGAVALDPFVLPGRLDDVRRVLAVTMRGAIDRLLDRLADTVQLRGEDLDTPPEAGGPS